MTNKRYSGDWSDNPWLDSYTVTITSDRGTSHRTGGYITWSLADEAARGLVDMMECSSERGLVVTIAQTT